MSSFSRHSNHVLAHVTAQCSLCRLEEQDVNSFIILTEKGIKGTKEKKMVKNKGTK